MQTSILIVSKNRKEELSKTLLKIKGLLDFSIHEVLVFLDGCTDGSEDLKNEFSWVKWFGSNTTIGASGSRAILYPHAKGSFFIGLDDDAHPLQADFIAIVTQIFSEYPKVGVLAFQEIKGVFNSNVEALTHKKELVDEYLCHEFVGCGFAIRKVVYEATSGFPVWMDIYGEESCVSIEVLANGYDILYTNRIAVNHRVNREERLKTGKNYYRFDKQLKNTVFYYLVYYPFPLMKIAKLLWHNFKKYACSDRRYFHIYFQSLFSAVTTLPKILSHRKPIDSQILKRICQLPPPRY
ncbi:glycosyltransferase family 2 protein [Flavobacterium hiemivividum]|uniref:Glycosyltransferase family 2 protein n=1 Tax=Flavobacterium hiemivividum TaxID=2541734 RepID=A0A4R5CXS4_9FLAO|nr:glycosyltransferase [Flavobacterium hiemivividum]TDE04587.1 glycosyltransferase family 2 protein [Flavobacterium hiemivividum]